jgi:hypothetical protein
MSEVFPSMALTSGMLGRILIIAGSKGQRVSKPKLDTKMRPILIHDLKEISKLQGEMVLTPEADKAFDAWYEKINPYPPAELVSFYERKHDHVLKLAMIISIAESDELVLTVNHLNSAIEAIEMAESEMPEALAYIGASIQSTLADRIFAVIKSYHPTPVSHSVLLRRVYRKIQSSSEFKDVIETLKDANKIVIEASQQGIFYSVKEKKDEDKQSNHKSLKKSKNK